MNVELKVKVKTMKDLERVLTIESNFCFLEIYPACFYIEYEKTRYINIDDRIHDGVVTVSDKTITFKVELDTKKYNDLMFIEHLFTESGIVFKTRYNLKDKTEEWLIDNITGPMEVMVS